MSETIQIAAKARTPRRTALWLQIVTLVWMSLECGVSFYSAVTSHSAAILAFGADSLVELLSATVVLLRFLPVPILSERKASRLAGGLLVALAFVVFVASMASILLRVHAKPSVSGIAITVAAPFVMPLLAHLKRREAHRVGSRALAADAIQSATCAWLALTALAGLAANALFHLWWLDSAAALVAIPLLIREGRSAWQGDACGCS